MSSIRSQSDVRVESGVGPEIQGAVKDSGPECKRERKASIDERDLLSAVPRRRHPSQLRILASFQDSAKFVKEAIFRQSGGEPHLNLPRNLTQTYMELPKVVHHIGIPGLRKVSAGISCVRPTQS